MCQQSWSVNLRSNRRGLHVATHMQTESHSHVVATCNTLVDTLVVATCETSVVNCCRHVKTFCTRNHTVWLLPHMKHRLSMSSHKSVSNLWSNHRVSLPTTCVHTKSHTLVVATCDALVDTLVATTRELSVVNCCHMRRCPVASLRSHHQKSQMNHMQNMASPTS
jgi:hypothetical protein